MQNRILSAGLALALLPVASVSAQTAGQGATPAPIENPNSVTITPGSSIAEAVAGMAAAAKATVVVDPALTGRVSAATAKLSLEAGLSAIAEQYRARWRKVYLDAKSVPRTSDGKVDARRLKAIVEAASAAPAQTVGVVDPATGQMTVTSRASEKSPAMVAWSKGQTPIYLLYLPGAVAAPPPPARPDAMLPPGGMEALRNMTPEQRKQWMDQNGGVVITSDMSQAERAALLQRLPPEERERIERRMQDTGDGGQVVIMRKVEPAP